MKKDIKVVKMWAVKAYCGYKDGWRIIEGFRSFEKADNWLMEYVRKNNYSITDFNIVCIETI